MEHGRGEGDFSATSWLLILAGLAVIIGGIGAVLPWALLRLINFFTNLFYCHRFSIAEVSPANHELGALSI